MWKVKVYTKEKADAYLLASAFSLPTECRFGLITESLLKNFMEKYLLKMRKED